MTEFPGNAKAPRPQASEPKDEKKIESVVTNEVTTRKKSLLKRFVNVFIGGDSKTVVNYVLMDVLLPQAREMIADAASSGVERMIYGEARPGHRRGGPSRYAGGGPTAYNRYAVRGNNPLGRAGADDKREVHDRVRGHEVDDLLFATRVEAETTLERMYDLLKEYETVSIADLNSLVERSSSYTDQKWGWTNLHGCRIFRDRSSGYVLELPKVGPID
jgi:hypothetical protein